MKRFFAALVLSMFLSFGVRAQARQAESKASEYNFTGCSPSGLMAEHGVLSADGKKLDFTYYRDGDSVVKDETPSHLVLEGQIGDPRKDGSRKFDAIGYLPDGEGGKATVVAHGQIYKNRFAILIFIHDDLRYVFYGYEGKVDELVKLDQDEATAVCIALVSVGIDGIPDVVAKWLHQDDAPAPNESKS